MTIRDVLFCGIGVAVCMVVLGATVQIAAWLMMWRDD